MQGYFEAIHFLRSMMNPAESIVPDPIRLEGEQFIVTADVYRPREKPKAVILLVHGMTPFGSRDPRMISLGKACAMSGYLGIVPDYALIRQGMLEVQSVSDVVNTVLSVTSNESLCPEGYLAIFTASFSGAICLRAACDDRVNDKITSMMIVGGCNNPANCFRDILSNPSPDHYAKLVLLKNLAAQSIENDVILSRAISCAIEDAYANGRKGNSLHHYLVSLPTEDEQRVLKLLKPVLDNENVMPRYKVEIERLHQKYMQIFQIDKIKCKIALAHSSKDDVIAPSESEDLYQQLKEQDVGCRMAVTPVLEHASLALTPRYFIGLVRLIKVFSYFFDHIHPEDAP